MGAWWGWTSRFHRPLEYPELGDCVMVKQLRYLARFAFRRWRGQQQRLVESVAETKRGLHVATKIGDDDLLIQNGTILSNPGAIGRQGEIHHTVGKPECGRPFIKNEWGVQSVANRNYGCLRRARFGVVCHDGSYRFWEWNDEKACLVPFVTSSPK